MTSHRILTIWIFIYIILLIVCLSLFLVFEAIRIKIAILLVGLIISFIFCPVYNLDKRNSMRIKKGQKSEKSKILFLKDNESEKEKESFVIKEQESKTQDDPVKKIEIICEFCGKKIEAEVKLCPYCGTEL